MSLQNSKLGRTSALIAVWLLSVSVTMCRGEETEAAGEIRAVRLSAGEADEEQFRWARSRGMNAVVLELKATDPDGAAEERAAAERIRQAGLDLFYWIEIARSHELADAHPEWMASLQGHDEWRRFFKNAPVPADGEVVKTYPWVPILYREAFDAHRRRVEHLVSGKPAAKGVLLNDLQGAPSACGCGNSLCRWTADYGPTRTATPLGADAAAQFIAAVKRLAPDSQVIPVWTTECEEHDGAPDGLCAGVGCFRGTCWKAYTEQLMPVAAEVDQIAVLLLYREFQRDLPIYGKEAGWIEHALQSFQEMPPRRGGKSIAGSRLIAVLQGWDVTADEIEAQIARAKAAGAAGYVVARSRIDQGWTPRLVRWKMP